MSDYCRTRAIVYPLGDDAAVGALCKSLGVEDQFDLEELKPELFKRAKGSPYFEIEAPDDDYYLSYVLYYEYGADCGEFCRNRFLSQTEQEKYKPIFEQVLPTVDTGKLKYVDYCYYNASESPDFYNAQDEFNTEI